jgi:chloramphenicol-sensitive protein RarD
MSDDSTRTRAAGVAYAGAAYLSWGLFPLYFRALRGVPAPEVLAHRIGWSAAFLLVVATALRRWGAVVRLVRAPRTLGALGASAAFISANWLVYIWAVNSGHVLEASLGYFVNPIVTVLLGVVFLRERLGRRQWTAVALAAAGVLVLVVRAGRVPWIALALALTFGVYGLIRKQVRADAVDGLLVEVGLLAPLALAFLAALAARGASHFGSDPRFTTLLAASGVVTAMPLIWFANAVSRLRLSTVGILQYLNPSAQLAIAVFVFGEAFTPTHLLAFGCIWAALALYTQAVVRPSAPPA